MRYNGAMASNLWQKQVTVKLPYWMHDGLKTTASRHYQSMHGLILVALSEWLESKGIKEPVPEEPNPFRP